MPGQAETVGGNAGCGTAATGARSLRAVTVNPGGATLTVTEPLYVPLLRPPGMTLTCTVPGVFDARLLALTVAVSHEAEEVAVKVPAVVLVTDRLLNCDAPFTAEVKLRLVGDTVSPVDVPPLTVRFTVMVAVPLLESMRLTLPV